MSSIPWFLRVSGMGFTEKLGNRVPWLLRAWEARFHSFSVPQAWDSLRSWGIEVLAVELDSMVSQSFRHGVH